MDRLTTTPFGQRALSRALVADALADLETPTTQTAEKWPLFRELCIARVAFGLTDRDLSVLNALLTFHQLNTLSAGTQLVVFPSNKTLGARANGMAESTLRRHLAALVSAGVIRRHDSPNGKRYARKVHNGVIALAFGFDLSPLLELAEEITLEATRITEVAASYKLLSDEVSLVKRDAVKLLQYGTLEFPDLDWDGLQCTLLDIHKRNRRKLDPEILAQMRDQLNDVLAELQDFIRNATEEMSGNDIQNERHCQSSKTEITKIKLDDSPEGVTHGAKTQLVIPLRMIKQAAPDIMIYADGNINSWDSLYGATCTVVRMMGVKEQNWSNAQNVLGPINASVVLACMLQRITEIQSPDAYLASLTRRAKGGAFSPLPMVMALLNQQNKVHRVDSCQLS